MSTSIVFVHGMYLNGASWAPWVDRACKRGFATHAPSWPFHEGSPTTLRSAIDPALGKLDFATVLGHMKSKIDALPERPVVVGHSIGGLLAQKLLADGYATAAVAISSAPPQGIFTLDPTFTKANLPHVNPFAGNAPVEMTPERFHFTFCNTMTRAESDKAFEEFVVPESRNVPRSTLTKQAHIDFTAPHEPLLFLTGDSDHLTPRALVRKNFDAYRDASSTREFVAYAGRSHFICNQEGWQEVADRAFEWIELVS
jgi:alpha-beta hydrolase superfamily lysophospholipase